MNLVSSILQTLAYADIFDYPLKEKEIWLWLIFSPNFPFSSSNLSSNSPPKLSFKESLEELSKKGLIETREGFFFLHGRSLILGLRKKRSQWSEGKMKIAHETAEKLKFFPWIKTVGITGALAMKNCDEKDDIDLLIITSANRLWLTRLIVFLFSRLLGIKRRKPSDKDVKDKICFNLFLDENHLKISPENLFLAHEICQVKPLVNKDKTYEKFLWENRWLKNFLPNATKISSKFKVQSSKLQCKIQNWFSIIFGSLEKIVYRVQYFYMKPKITHEKISLSQAFFHPRDLSKTIEDKLKLCLKSISFFSL